MSAIDPDQTIAPIEPSAPASVEPAESFDSLKTKLQAARRRAQNLPPEDFPIPGSANTLWGTFKVLTDYVELREVVSAQGSATTEAEGELYVAAETIAKSCTELYALIDGQKKPFEMSIIQVANTYYDAVAENDRQAVFAIFPDTSSVAEFAGNLDTWFETARSRADEVVSGNSEAASS